VVGYVQSGKTANMAAVMAKSIDVGYRLIIVLTGMHEGLRKQTQRRLDMELLGKPNILQGFSPWEARDRAAGEYLLEPSWEGGGFSNLQGLPPSPDIIRLTSFQSDFSHQQSSGLAFRDHSMLGEVYEPRNLYGFSARIAVVKKNSTVLGHLLAALKQNRYSIAQIPALIIDDESDQASVNTAKPASRPAESKDEKIERKAINERISQILQELKRGQYVGYTATPFANVFIDPSDLEDIFPRDFIVSLAEPLGYMGASSFFNSVQPSTPTYNLSNKAAFIRSLQALDSQHDEQDVELLQAMAHFVLTGAIKLYRQSLKPSLAANYRHHTMLVHESAGKASHKKIRDRIVRLWQDAQWNSSSGERLLKNAFVDLRQTLEDRRDDSAAFVDDFALLLPFVDETVNRIESLTGDIGVNAEHTVTIVNSDKEIGRKLDFDHHSTWKIVVGGAMLSRGFTIEGLTVSYFRRSPKAQDTLLQMGRWFGYRPGYRDLVRVYLATNTALSKNQLVNLYDAFNSMAETEAEFRQQLSLYSEWNGDVPGITPEEVVPLVQQSLPWLKPTAPNKMYNARIVSQQTAVFSPKGLAWDSVAVERNWDVARRLIDTATQAIEIAPLTGALSPTPAWVGIANVSSLFEVLIGTEYLGDYGDLVVNPKASYYAECHRRGSLSDFLIIFPQLIHGEKDAGATEISGLGTRSLVRRSRNFGKDSYYGEYTAETHRKIAYAFLGQEGLKCPEELAALSSEPARGVILAYLFQERGSERGNDESVHDFRQGLVPPTKCAMGLTIYLPNSALAASNGSRITWAGKTGQIA
jgi:hypothetical protein